MKENMRDSLTNEALKALFKNNFLLVNQAINLARFYIKSGHEVKMSKLLQELKNNPSEDYLKDLQELEDADNNDTHDHE
jgi:cellobiose-specific phosphotransferase system component IIA